MLRYTSFQLSSAESFNTIGLLRLLFVLVGVVNVWDVVADAVMFADDVVDVAGAADAVADAAVRLAAVIFIVSKKISLFGSHSNQ